MVFSNFWNSSLLNKARAESESKPCASAYLCQDPGGGDYIFEFAWSRLGVLVTLVPSWCAWSRLGVLLVTVEYFESS